MKLTLTPEASRDLVETVSWFSESSSALPGRFEEMLDRTFQNISKHPESYPMVHRRFRRALMKTFPWAVFYTIEKDLIVVHAIVHQARHPLVWKRRP